MPVLLIILFPGRLYALTSSQLFSIENGSVYYQGGASSAPQGCSVSSTTLTGSDNEQKTWNFFIGKGLSAPQVAGIMGNIQQESSFDPEAVQNGGNSKTPTTQASLGWGMAMWTPSVNGPNPVLGDAATYHITTPIYTLATQLNIIWAQMNGTSPTGATDMLAGLKAINDPTGAQQAVYFEATFEEGTIAYSGGGQASQRETYAAQFLSLYGKTSSTSSSTSSVSSSSSCSSGTISSSCSTPSSSSNNITNLRQNIVCLAKGQLALWKSQPNYNAPYPGFTYAATGFLKYTASGNTYEEWCADFASWIYNQAGHPFTGGISGWDLPGVSGIETLAQQGTGFSWHPAGSGYIPQPGDLAIYSTPSNPDFHVNIFISSSGGISTYIGGDQGGNNTPYGAYGSAPPTPSGSVVSEVTFSGYYSNNIIGYVSPN